MEVKILNSTQETVITCQEVFLNYKEGYISFDFIDDATARLNEEFIKKMSGKTLHNNNTITITNLSDFNFSFK